MTPGPQPTCLLIADISGYTGYLAEVELDHAQDILADLIGTVVRALRPGFRLAKLEGDAAFTYATGDTIDGTQLLDTVERCYLTFRRRRRDVRQATSCPCNACTRIPEDLVASREGRSLAIRSRPVEGGGIEESWEQRHIASTLGGPRHSRSQLFFNALLPLARAQRCDVAVAPNTPPLPLEVDDFPYQPIVLVEETEDEGISVRAELHRKDERVDLQTVTALLPRDDIGFLGARAIRIRTDDAAGLLSRIMSEGVIQVPKGDVRDMLRLLWAACGPRMLRLPPSYASIAGRDVPVVTRAVLMTPPPGRSKRRMPFVVEVLFEYDGVSVPWRDRRDYHPDLDKKRVIRRDRALEHDAIDALVSAGFRLKHGPSGDAELTLATSKLIAAVSTLPADRFLIVADGFRVRPSSTASMSIKSGIDWFDLRANIAFDGVAAPMPAILEAVRRGDGLVRLGDHGTGVLPAKWLERLERVIPLSAEIGDDDALRFLAGQVSLVEQIVDDPLEPIAWDGPIAELRKKLAAQAKPPLAPSPTGFLGELRDYQRAGLSWMRGLEELGFSGCLADDMGLGKTIQALAFLAGRKAEGRAKGPTLVVAPRSVVHNWLDEARRFAPSLYAIEHRRGSVRFENVDLVITTYATLRSDIDTLKKVAFDYVVLDEAHAIKNGLSSTAKAACRLVARSRLALTGTPVENHLGELASLFAFLNPGMLGPSIKATAKAGFDADKEQIARIGRGLSPFLLRRRKRDVLTELPERIEQTIHVELGDAQRALYDRVKKHYRDVLLSKPKVSFFDRDHVDEASSTPAKAGFEVFAALLRLRQLAVHPALIDPASAEVGSAKMDALLEHLEPIASQGKKALVFSQFTAMLDYVGAALAKKGIRTLRLDGNTKDRRDVVSRFQDDPNVPVFLVSLKAGGVGLNLTAAEYVFLLDPWWNPAAEAQAIDRAHRMGQTRSVVAYRLVSVDTIEDRLMDLQQKKRELVASVLGENEGLMPKAMTVEDLDALLT